MGRRKPDRLDRVIEDLDDVTRELVADYVVMLKRMSRRSRRDVEYFADTHRRRMVGILVLERRGSGEGPPAATFVGRPLSGVVAEAVSG